jgi:hypothetical protein
MQPLWIHTFFKGYILGPKMVELGKVQILLGILGILSTQIYSLKSITPILFIKK